MQVVKPKQHWNTAVVLVHWYHMTSHMTTNEVKWQGLIRRIAWMNTGASNSAWSPFFTMQASTVSSDSSTKWKEEQNKQVERVSLKTTAGKMSTQLSVWLHKTQTVTTKMTVFVRSTKATVTNTLLLLLLLLLLLCCCCSCYCVPIWTLKGLHDICNCTLNDWPMNSIGSD